MGETVEASRGGWGIRLRRWVRREPELVFRLAGLTIIAALTQYNHLTTKTSELRVHLGVMILLGLWALVSILFRFAQRGSRRPDGVRLAWAATDLLFLTAIIRWLDATDTSLVVGYPLLIAASGLWSRVRLVWYTTALAAGFYALLYFEAAARQALGADAQYPNIFLAALAVEGLVVAHQIKRLRALSAYCEQRRI